MSRHKIPGKHDLMQCPYDPVHKIAAYKLSNHITKCRKNFPNQNMSACTYNSAHIVPEPELRIHEESCPAKVDYLRDLTAVISEDDSKVKGKLEMPKTAEASPFDQAENWNENFEDPKVDPECVQEKLKNLSFRETAWLKPHEKKKLQEDLSLKFEKQRAGIGDLEDSDEDELICEEEDTSPMNTTTNVQKAAEVSPVASAAQPPMYYPERRPVEVMSNVKIIPNAQVAPNVSQGGVMSAGYNPVPAQFPPLQTAVQTPQQLQNQYVLQEQERPKSLAGFGRGRARRI